MKKNKIIACILLILSISFCFACTDNRESYDIVINTYMSYGIVSGSGKYHDGDNVKLIIKPNMNQDLKDVRFVALYHENVAVAYTNSYNNSNTENPYTFKTTYGTIQRKNNNCLEYSFTANNQTKGTYVAFFEMSSDVLQVATSLSYENESLPIEDSCNLKEIIISVSSNNISYTNIYSHSVTENSTKTFSLNSFSSFENPIAIIDSNPLYVKVEEIYEKTINDNKEELKNITIKKISSISIKNSIENKNENIIELKLNKQNMNSQTESVVSLTFDYYSIGNFE